MHAAPIMQYLQQHSQKSDLEIAHAMDISLEKTRLALSILSMSGSVRRSGASKLHGQWSVNKKFD